MQEVYSKTSQLKLFYRRKSTLDKFLWALKDPISFMICESTEYSIFSVLVYALLI